MAYVPILKTKAGEIEALGRSSCHVRRAIRPIPEIHHGSASDPVRLFLDTALSHLPPGMVTSVDTRPLTSDQLPCADEDHSASALQRLSDEFAAWRMPLRPVIRLDASPAELTAAANAVGLHGRGAVLRLSRTQAAGDERRTAADVRRVVRQLELTYKHLDLLIDVGELTVYEDAYRTAPPSLLVGLPASRLPRTATVTHGKPEAPSGPQTVSSSAYLICEAPYCRALPRAAVARVLNSAVRRHSAGGRTHRVQLAHRLNPGTCEVCGHPLPPGRGQSRRRTCSARCRQRAYRSSREQRAATPPKPRPVVGTCGSTQIGRGEG